TIAWPSGLLVAAAYAYLAGFSLPTQRALIMLCLFVLAALLGRPLSLVRALLLAMAAVLLLDPLAFEQLGACLSFFAVAVLAYGFAGRRATGGLWGGLFSLLKAQLLLGCFLPVALYALGLANGQLGLPANLLAIPLLSFIILPLLLFAAAQEFVGLAWLWPWQWADFALLCLLDYCRWLASLVPQQQQALWWPAWAHSLWLVGGLLLAALLLWLPRGLPGRYLALLPLCLALGLKPAAEPGLRIMLLDVGQGLALVLERQGQVLLYDTGPRFSARFNAGSAIIAPYLRRRGVQRIEQLIISHGDLDHAGGFEALAGQFAIGQLWVEPSELGRYRAYKPQSCQRGRQWQWRGVSIRALWPQPLEPGADKSAYKRNNRSCVLLLQYQGLKLLLTGDIESWAERRILSPALAGVDIMLAPHHGSNSSSHPAWVALTRPRWLLSSAAYRSHYGHPHPKVLARYQESAALNTASTGALLFEYQPDSAGVWRLIGPRRQRIEGRRYWYSAN
ncbi:MAG: DNA internalization-related competence protein ComEC/Rec2, partial [Cellvibrionaceae bacterium]|nr:DNA internalization-related competence protein ComEC/Rec2 [Cellvibrionaceae bacterium]